MRLVPDLLKLAKPYKRNITQDDVNEAAKRVWSQVRDGINDHQFSAFTWFELTAPKGAFARSVMLRLFNEGKILSASKEFNRFVIRNGAKSKRLAILRNKQKKLFLRPVIVSNREIKNARI